MQETEVKKTTGKVLVAMSGGVDSSVAAAVLKGQGMDVIGVHLQLWDEGDSNFEREGARCCSAVDANDARRVCDRLGIPFYVVNATKIFKSAVVDYFVHEYIQTRTPNPCVECNTKIKFSYLFNKADELGCDFVATGHYARVDQDHETGDYKLYKSLDPQKDQSYYLFGLTQKALKRTIMPLGNLTKTIVRKIAGDFGLSIADKPDSQEICFVGAEGYQGFIEERVAASLRPRGVIRTAEGLIVGEHEGLYRFTIGQRRGLNLTGAESQEAYYVVGFDQRNHVLIVGKEEQLFQTELSAANVNWIRPVDQLRGLNCQAKIRSRSQDADCLVTTFSNNSAKLRFKNPQRAVTPGQAVVLYQGEEVLGGGFIERAGPY